MKQPTIEKMNEYQRNALRTAPEPGGKVNVNADLLHGAIGVATESGEILDAIKKHLYYGKPLDIPNLREEIGDVMWYLALLCRATDTDLSVVATVNIEKLRVRFPHSFDPDRAINRNLSNERSVLEGKS
jgi:NTP pyrophosphatase (non-canonical NTP hydrolase)